MRLTGKAGYYQDNPVSYSFQFSKNRVGMFVMRIISPGGVDAVMVFREIFDRVFKFNQYGCVAGGDSRKFSNGFIEAPASIMLDRSSS